jgi:DNA-binding MurR/RpiR family transcriptional regulator
MAEEFLIKIDNKYNEMTKTQKKTADYIIKNYLQLPFMSVQEVGAAASVSPASIHRFCIYLGYSGFSEFQKEIQVYLQKTYTEAESAEYNAWNDLGTSVLKNQINTNLQVLSEMFTEELEANFNKAVNLILAGKRIYIIGLRASYGCSFLLYYLLKDYMNNITILTLGVDDIYDRISSVSSDDILISMGFKPYTKYTVDIIRYFKEYNAKTITITDVYSSPLSIYSDISLIPGNTTHSYGFVMAVTIVKALSVSVLQKLSSAAMEQYTEKQVILKKNDIYL